MTVRELRELLRDMPDDAAIAVCDENGDEQEVLVIEDAGWVNELGSYVLWVRS